MAELRIAGNLTNFNELQAFARDAGNSKIRAKETKAGTIILYTSDKKGTGLKNFLFGTTAKRQNKAQDAIGRILFNVPRPQGNAGLALGVVLSNVQTQLPHGELRGDALRNLVDQAAVAINDSQRDQLLATVPQRQDLPLGMNVTAQGVISGQATLTTTALGNQVVQLDSALTQTAQGFLGQTKTVGGVVITTKANDDMVRMNLDIPGYGKTMGPPGGDGTPEMIQKMDDNALALRQFAGSDNATTVLSSCCSQYLLRRFESALDNVNGDKQSLVLANRGNPVDFTHIDQNGQSHNVGLPTQYSAADFQLGTYPNGDFRITISWDLYATGFRNATPPSVPQVVMPDNQLMKTNIQAEIRIDKTQADLGNLVLTLPQSPVITFDGMI